MAYGSAQQSVEEKAAEAVRHMATACKMAFGSPRRSTASTPSTSDAMSSMGVRKRNTPAE